MFHILLFLSINRKSSSYTELEVSMFRFGDESRFLINLYPVSLDVKNALEKIEVLRNNP